MSDDPQKLLILGAHPDDAEFHAGGLASLYRSHGHVVKMVSVSNGAAGHHVRLPEELIPLRRDEATAAGRVIGADYEVWEYPDSELQPTLDLRRRIITELRVFEPDLVLTHRICDYHPDHRAVGQAVQDAAYLITVPNVLPEVPHLKTCPIILSLPDLFTRPCPLQPDVVIDTTDQIDTIVSMLACHASQMFEWLPYSEGIIDQVPSGEDDRQNWLKQWYGGHASSLANRFRLALISAFGESIGGQIEFAEFYEVSEYGTPLDGPARCRLFSFLKSKHSFLDRQGL